MAGLDDLRLPRVCSIAFKEWSGVCAALETGYQSVILRKGGIAEISGEFSPEHTSFWLYPTHLHEVEQGLRVAPAQADSPPDGMVELRVLVTVDVVRRVEDLDTLDSVSDLHVWTRETVEKRFHYRKPGLWVLGVRAFRAMEPVKLAVTTEFVGCKTWVELRRELPTGDLRPVLPSAEHHRRMERLYSALSQSGHDPF